jgi:hypothetical protein
MKSWRAFRIDVGLQNLSVRGELRGSVLSSAQLNRNLEHSFGKPAEPLLPFAVDGRIELRAELSGNLPDRNPESGALEKLTAQESSREFQWPV